MLYSLTYISVATQLMQPKQLSQLLERSRINNAAADITGLLLYKDGRFMQILEGEKESVERLYARVCADTRHRDVMRMGAVAVRVRSFATWSMAFRDLATAPANPAFAPFLNTTLSADEFAHDPTRAQDLLMLFRENV